MQGTKIGSDNGYDNGSDNGSNNGSNNVLRIVLKRDTPNLIITKSMYHIVVQKVNGHKYSELFNH